MITVIRMRHSHNMFATELIIDLMREEGLPVGAFTRRRLMESIGGAEEWVYLAWDHQQVGPVGILQLKLSHDPVTGDRLEAFRLYVQPVWRKSGAGAKLVRFALADLPEEFDTVPVYISTTGPLRRSFARMGFRTVATIHAAPLCAIKEAMER